ncbi:MAG: 3-keto-disaccharide hydrolase [Luteitalea sp.]
MRRLSTLLLAAAMLVAGAGSTYADTRDFLGRWNITGTGADSTAVFWLELSEANGGLTGMFLNRGGSPVKLAAVAVKGNELTFTTAGAGTTPGQSHRATVSGGKLTGQVATRDRTLSWVGVRPPTWPAADANARHTFGTPVTLIDGTSLDAWTAQRPDRPLGWTAVDGALTNGEKANNLVSKQTFKDFRIQAEYKIAPNSNSGIYLRGRYELQVLDDHGKPPESHGHMAIYAWTAPRVNATKPADQWQVMEATIVANKVTVTLNGQRVHDNVTIEAITGGAIDANETEPGPIVLQGDHGQVWYRTVVVTPIVKAAGTDE